MVERVLMKQVGLVEEKDGVDTVLRVRCLRHIQKHSKRAS